MLHFFETFDIRYIAIVVGRIKLIKYFESLSIDNYLLLQPGPEFKTGLVVYLAELAQQNLLSLIGQF